MYMSDVHCELCDAKCVFLLTRADMPASTMAVDVLQFWSTWLSVGVLLGLSVQRSPRLIRGGVHSTTKGLTVHLTTIGLIVHLTTKGLTVHSTTKGLIVKTCNSSFFLNVAENCELVNCYVT